MISDPIRPAIELWLRRQSEGLAEEYFARGGEVGPGAFAAAIRMRREPLLLAYRHVAEPVFEARLARLDCGPSGSME